MIAGDTYATEVERFLRLAVDGDARAGIRIAVGLLDQGVPGEVVIVKLLAAAQREVGERWLRNEWSIADEHLVTGATQRALDAVANTLEVPAPEGRVIVACAQGDWHSLPAQMFAELLRIRGFGVLFLGASTPADHLADLIRRRRPDALAVSCNLPIFLGGVTMLADAAHREGIPVIAGGRALGAGPARALRLGAEDWAPGIDDAELILRRWQQRPPQISAESATVDTAALTLDRDAEALAAVAFQALKRTYPAMSTYHEAQLARTQEDLAFIVRFAAAARHADDPSVFTDFIEWLQTVLSVRGVPPQALAAGLQALAPLLDARDPKAGELTRDAFTWIS